MKHKFSFILILLSFIILCVQPVNAQIRVKKDIRGGRIRPDSLIGYYTVDYENNRGNEKIFCSGKGATQCPESKSSDAQHIEKIIISKIIEGENIGKGTKDGITFSWRDGRINEDGIIEYSYEIKDLPVEEIVDSPEITNKEENPDSGFSLVNYLETNFPFDFDADFANSESKYLCYITGKEDKNSIPVYLLSINLTNLTYKVDTILLSASESLMDMAYYNENLYLIFQDYIWAINDLYGSSPKDYEIPLPNHISITDIFGLTENKLLLVGAYNYEEPDKPGRLLPESKYAMISANKNVPKMENSDALFSENSDV